MFHYFIDRISRGSWPCQLRTFRVCRRVPGCFVRFTAELVYSGDRKGNCERHLSCSAIFITIYVSGADNVYVNVANNVD